jgi:hypothetical protein
MTYPLTRDAPEQFLQAFNALAATKGGLVDDIKQEAFYQTLSDLPISAVVEAAQALQREEGTYLQDAGTWYRRADQIACARLKDDATRALPASVAPDEDERTRTRAARDKFVKHYESYVGRTLPDTHPWKSDDIWLPTYSCLTCHDTGWQDHPGLTKQGDPILRVGRCACFLTNPVLEARRGHGLSWTRRGRA